ncbi:hypothetical protein CWE15_06480 [Aliidiomarina taiwanensis]|uniref:Uncharacterized protein n=1 Tax=Aliidiomarina taiwanensis TaxID=946228 RepID=A0A432X856_9GAMM|nr:hypothetical protein [Aliidiomarina taiwanensis]RUO43043.1 hypothetical protein CWE15_06480 [Aliidiomarina taiwanensis]
MTLTDIVLAMNIGVLGVLGLHQTWLHQAQLYQKQQQVQQARADALQLLAQWQQAPSAGQANLGQAHLYSHASSPTQFTWQLQFQGFAGPVLWHGTWQGKGQQASGCEEK